MSNYFLKIQLQKETSKKTINVLCVCVCVCQLLSYARLFATPQTIAHQAPLSMEFSRQEYLNGQPFHYPGDLPNPGVEPESPALQADSLLSEHQGSLVHGSKIKKQENFLPAPSVKSSWERRLSTWISLVVQWLRLHAANAGGLGSIPGQGTRSHMLQLRVHMPQLKIPHAAMKTKNPTTKTLHSQINTNKKLKKKNRANSISRSLTTRNARLIVSL